MGFQIPDSEFPDRHGFWGRSRETRKPTRMAHTTRNPTPAGSSGLAPPNSFTGRTSRPGSRRKAGRAQSRFSGGTPSPAGRAGRGRGEDGGGRGLGLAAELVHRPDEPAGVAETDPGRLVRPVKEVAGYRPDEPAGVAETDPGRLVRPVKEVGGYRPDEPAGGAETDPGRLVRPVKEVAGYRPDEPAGVPFPARLAAVAKNRDVALDRSRR